MAFNFLHLHQFPVCVNLSIFYYFLLLLFTKLARIALQRSEETRILFRSNVCLLDPEMLVFLDESGFVSFHNYTVLRRFSYSFTILAQIMTFFVNLLLFTGQKTFSH